MALLEQEINELYADYLDAIKPNNQAQSIFQKLEAEAIAGSAVAQNKVGEIYQYGQGVRQSYIKAFELYQKSAAKNNADGQRKLGTLYRDNTGITEDFTIEKKFSIAMELFKKSAAQGNDHAMHNIGDMYEKGMGVPKNIDQAIIWYEKSAAAGNQFAKKAADRLNSDVAKQKQTLASVSAENQRLIDKGKHLPVEKLTSILCSEKQISSLLGAYNKMTQGFYEAIMDSSRKLVVALDGDGTIFNSRPVGINLCQSMMSKDNPLKTADPIVLQNLIKKDREGTWAAMFGPDPEKIKLARDKYNEILDAIFPMQVKLLPGAADAIRVFAQLRDNGIISGGLMIATNNSEARARETIKWLTKFDGVNVDVFDKILGSLGRKKGDINKSDPAFIARMGIDKTQKNLELWMLGDHDKEDLKVAQNVEEYTEGNSKGVFFHTGRTAGQDKYNPDGSPWESSQPLKIRGFSKEWGGADMVRRASAAAMERAANDITNLAREKSTDKPEESSALLKKAGSLLENATIQKADFIKSILSQNSTEKAAKMAQITEIPSIIVLHDDAFIFKNIPQAVEYGWKNSVKDVIKQSVDDAYSGAIPAGGKFPGLWLRQALPEEANAWIDKLAQDVLNKRAELIASKSPANSLKESYAVLESIGLDRATTDKIAMGIATEKYLEKFVEGFGKLFAEGKITITPEADALFKDIEARKAKGEDIKIIRYEHKREWVMDGEKKILTEKYPTIDIENRGMDRPGEKYNKPFPTAQEQDIKTLHMVIPKTAQVRLCSNMEAMYGSAAKGNASIIAVDADAKPFQNMSTTFSSQGNSDISVKYPVLKIDAALEKIQNALDGKDKGYFENISARNSQTQQGRTAG